MIKRNILLALVCCSIFTLHADQAVQETEIAQALPTKESIFAAITAPDLNPRTLQILANAFYWSHRSKKETIIATQTAKKNILLAHNILLKTYNLEYAYDDRVATFFKEWHETWKTAHEMQRAQNACVGILSFKPEVNDLANDILMLMCSDAAAALLHTKDAVLERAEQLNAAQSKTGSQDAQFTPKLQEFYTALGSQDLDVISPSMQNINNYISKFMRSQFATAHAVHDIRTDIMSAIDEIFAHEFLEWYRVIYSTMQDRGLIDTPYGTLMCDQTGLLEEENRPQMPRPEDLDSRA